VLSEGQVAMTGSFGSIFKGLAAAALGMLLGAATGR